MKAQWKDYQYGSWLSLIFGKVDAKIVQRDAVGQHWGIILHPGEPFEMKGTLDAAKRVAERTLRETLTEALTRLGN